MNFQFCYSEIVELQNELNMMHSGDDEFCSVRSNRTSFKKKTHKQSKNLDSILNSLKIR